MRGNFMRELAMLRGANEMQAEKMIKEREDAQNGNRKKPKLKLARATKG